MPSAEEGKSGDHETQTDWAQDVGVEFAAGYICHVQKTNRYEGWCSRGKMGIRLHAWIRRVQPFFDVCVAVAVVVAAVVRAVGWVEAVTDLPCVGHAVAIGVLRGRRR